VLQAGTALTRSPLRTPSRSIDLLITDVVMPRLAAPKLARRLSLRPGLESSSCRLQRQPPRQPRVAEAKCVSGQAVHALISCWHRQRADQRDEHDEPASASRACSDPSVRPPRPPRAFPRPAPAPAAPCSWRARPARDCQEGDPDVAGTAEPSQTSRSRSQRRAGRRRRRLAGVGCITAPPGWAVEGC